MRDVPCAQLPPSGGMLESPMMVFSWVTLAGTEWNSLMKGPLNQLGQHLKNTHFI